MSTNDEFAPLVRFSRPRAASYHDDDGVLQIAAVDTLRPDHYPDTLGYRGLLFESDEDARYAASIFGSFSTGTLVANFDIPRNDAPVEILSRGSMRLLYRNAGDPETVIRTSGLTYTATKPIRRVALAWSGSTLSLSANGDPVQTGSWSGWGDGDVIQATAGWPQWHGPIQYLTKRESDDRVQRLSDHPIRDATILFDAKLSDAAPWTLGDDNALQFQIMPRYT